MATFCSGGIIVYDDFSEDNTVEICRKHASILKVITGKYWDSNRARAEYENRENLLKVTKEYAKEIDWLVYQDADERIDFDWAKLKELDKSVIAIRMKLFDYYITSEDVYDNYSLRKWIGPEYREIIMAFRNLPHLSYTLPDQREVGLGKEGIILNEGFVKHYGKAISVEDWEKKCDYYSDHFPMYSEKWRKRKGKAVHNFESDFGRKLIKWEQKEELGINLMKENNELKINRKLNILIATHHLNGYTGSEILTKTLAVALRRNGHKVTVYSKYIDKIRTEFERFGIKLTDDLASIKNEKFDIAHVHHNINAIEIRYYFPTLHIVFYSQGVLPFLEQPPIIDLGIKKYLALSEEIRDNLISKGVKSSEIEIIRNFVDQDLFHSQNEISSIPRNVLVISGRLDTLRENIIKRSCERAGLNCKFVGGRHESVEQKKLIELIKQCDIVFSLGRGAIESMMCGRVTIIYDYLGGDGMVTPDTFDEIKKNNFSGRRFHYEYNEEELIAELKKYHKEFGAIIRQKIIEEYSIDSVIPKLLKLYYETIESPLLPTSNSNKEMEFCINTVNETRNYSYDLGRRHFRSELKNFMEVEKIINIAEDLINRNNLESAKQILRVLNFVHIENVMVLNNLASISIIQSDYESAIKYLEEVIRFDANNQIAIDNLKLLKNKLSGNLNINESEMEKTEIKDSQNENTGNFSKELINAEELLGNGNFSEAREILEKILEEDSTNLDAMNDLAVLNIMQNDFVTAKNFIQQIFKIDPSNEVAIDNWNYLNQRAYVNDDVQNELGAVILDIENKLKEERFDDVLTTAAPILEQVNLDSRYEKIACPFCGSINALAVRHAADIVKCADCEVVYLRYRLKKEEMYKLYQSYAKEDSHMALPKNNEQIKLSPLRRDYFLSEIIKFTKPTGVLLDVGCGWGGFLDNARDKGFIPVGIEMTKDCVDFANDVLKIKVTNEQFEDTPFDDNSISVISMNHVLEHLPYPLKVLRKMSRILKRGGLFAGMVPNFNSYVSNTLKDNWYWLDPNYHYVHYTPQTLQRQLEKVGFVVEKLYTATGDYGRDNVTKILMKDGNVDVNNVLSELNKIEEMGMGEEIRFIARKQ